MIDHKARDKLAEEIRHFMGCFTDNYKYDDAAFDIDTDDRGVNEVYENIWLTYDDLRRHKLEGKWALSDEQKVIFKRAIVFLKSDSEYKWPKWPIYYRIARPIIWLLTFGRLCGKFDHHFNGHGDLNAWPFHSCKEFTEAKETPVYMSKSHNHQIQPTQKAARLI